MHRALFALAAAGGVFFFMLPTSYAQTVWSGYDFSFTKANDTDVLLPENQDRITDNVWLTRKVQEGIYNIRQETGFVLNSPADTEWATYRNNPSETIAATNYENLVFAPWIEAYGGQGGGTLPDRLLGGPAVLHLITDDVYLDLQFTGWTSNQGGGGFSYDRALAPAGPDTTGDYNLDGFVDAADYVHWRKTEGDEVPGGTGADGVPDGTIDEDDYGFWVAQFGTDVSLGSADPAFTVPEPAGLPLVILAILCVNYVCRRRA
jgi:hypothetical protein